MTPENQEATEESGPTANGRPPAERADAARNRARILAAAQRILAGAGVEALGLNNVAAKANVGVGTVYRRFGDRAGLIAAMMDTRERQLQHDMIAGPPPLGPGAAPRERIRAFLHAYVDVLDDYASLMAVAEATMDPRTRFGTGAYAVHHQHLAARIRELDPDYDDNYLAAALLAPLAAAQFVHQRHHQHMSTDRIKAGLDALISGLPA